MIVVNAEDSTNDFSAANAISSSDVIYAKENIFPALEADLIYTPEEQHLSRLLSGGHLLLQQLLFWI
jgi:hypothetical protein